MTRSTAELRQYLAGEWLFNADFKDTSGNGNHGTPTDIEWKPTLRGMKPRFNGSSGKVDCGNDNSLEIPGDISIIGWAKTHNNQSDNCIYSRGWNVELKKGIFLEYDDTQVVRFSAANGTISQNLRSAIATTNDWIFICGIVRSNVMYMYVDGIEDVNTAALAGSIQYGPNNSVIGHAFPSGFHMKGTISNVRVYNTALSATEVLNLYNETKGEYGVMPAEHSFTHNLDSVIDASGAVGAWGTAKESTTELSDLSGNNNIATIHGAMPTEGFIRGRRFDGDDDYLDCGDDVSLMPASAITIEALAYPNQTGGNDYFIAGKYYNAAPWKSYGLLFGYGDIKFELRIDGENSPIANIPTSGTNKWYYLVGIYDGSNVMLWVDGVLVDSQPDSGSIDYDGYDIYIGKRIATSDLFNGDINSVRIYNHALSATEIQSNFNTLARLPFWSVNYTNYPDNVTEYTDNLPYSSSIINSGTFKVDDDKLQCVSAGTITYSASYAFDGSEFIKVTIDGVEYAGTGTITQGNTTVSVAQGSNKVTIQMGTGDTIEGEIGIQFREEV